MLMMLWGVLGARSSLKALWILTGLSLHFTAKENSYVACAIFAGYLVSDFVYQLVFRNRTFAETEIGRIWRYVNEYRLPTVLATAAAVFIFCYLYSAGFRHSEGILDGLWRKSIGYWLHHHKIERISGPFLFHFYVLSWYELPFIGIFFYTALNMYRNAIRPVQLAGLAMIVLAILMTFTTKDTPVLGQLWTIFKLKKSLDAFGLVILLIHPIILTYHHISRDERALAWFGYLFTANFFTYSYLGEKVPWLTLYPLVTGIVYFALFFNKRVNDPNYQPSLASIGLIIRRFGEILVVLGILFVLQEALMRSDDMGKFIVSAINSAKENSMFFACGLTLIIFGLLADTAKMFDRINVAHFMLLCICLWNIRAAIQTNFVYAGQAREYLSQVHTTPEFHDLMKTIRREVEVQNRGFKPKIFISGDATWPSTWYLRDIPEYKFTASEAERVTFDYIIQDYKEPPTNVPAGYEVAKINLRGWWVPDFEQMTLRGFLNYSLNHTPWNGVGHQYVHLLVKKRD
jgi:uncharacterized protein (TIGR03663 family)